MKTDLPHYVALADYKPPAFLVDHVDLTVRLDGASTRVAGRYRMGANPAAGHDGPHALLTLDVDGIGSVEARLNGVPVTLLRAGDTLTLDAPTGGPFELALETTLDPDGNTALSGLYRTGGIYCTQCEAEGFRRILPFPDRPEVLATYTVRLEAERDACPVLLSNGNPVGEDDLGQGWHAVTWHDPHPKPSYLFALVGGRLDRLDDAFTTMEGREVALSVFVEPGKTGQAGFAMEALKRSMLWDEQRFGRAYDLDVFNIVAVSDFNLGAMENKGLNIFNDKYILASPETATDEDYERIEAIIAHEYFHNWSGNRVTCRDWFQLCLKEGLTVFRDQEYTADLTDRSIKRIADVRTLWMHQFPEDAGPLAHPVRPQRYREINNFYTATVYEKGAEIVRMIALWLGPDRFRRAMDRYFDTHDGQAVRIEDFLACMQAEADPRERWPDFLAWYTQAGTPRVDVHIERQGATGTLRLAFSQATAPTPGQNDKQPLPIPCRLGLVVADGSAVSLEGLAIEAAGGRWRLDGPDQGVFLLEDGKGSLTVSGLPAQGVQPSLFRDFSAPVATRIEGLSDDDRLLLAARDPNGFNGWAQIQALCSDALQARYSRLALGEPPADERALLEALASRFTDLDAGSRGLALRAAALTLPTAHDLARTIGADVDPIRVVEAQRAFSAALCAHHGEDMLAALDSVGIDDSATISASEQARRSFVLTLLGHLQHWDDARAAALIADAHTRSVGMTMRIRTLALLVRSRHPEAVPALAAFERRFGTQPLAMDKWFTVQATAWGADALGHIERLTGHAAYSPRNPNRVRALIGAFSMANLEGFHAADGSGYRLLADEVARIDGDNPQLAARLASAFRSWRQFAGAQRAQARTALDGLMRRPSLSNDLSDIITRTLAD